MRKIILFAAAALTLFASCRQTTYSYTTQVIAQTRGTANWVDTNYRAGFSDPHDYKVGDTLRGIFRDQVVIFKTVNN